MLLMYEVLGVDNIYIFNSNEKFFSSLSKLSHWPLNQDLSLRNPNDMSTSRSQIDRSLNYSFEVVMRFRP